MEQGKLYYSIGEVSKMFDVNTSLIRFWEKEFKKIKPKKNKKGNRQFTSSDIAIIKEIYELVKVKGFTLEGAKNIINGNDSPIAINKHDEIIRKLEEIKQNLKQLID